jgi:predicted AlkP superfamily pyrophosphatase or phosphodiesterase
MRPFLSLIFALFANAIATFASGPGRENDFAGRRVLLIGIDGCRADALRAAMESGKAPALSALAKAGCANWSVFAGGENGGVTEQATSSGPGWSSILTGVWRNKHGVRSNKFEEHRIADFPHFMRRIKDAKPSALCSSIADWPEIHDFIVDASRIGGAEFLDSKITLHPDPAKKQHDWPELDATIRHRATALLREENPDALFVYFGQVDEFGHAEADPAGRFSPDNAPYLGAIGRVDALIGDVLAAMRARPHFAGEDWLILVTTDHGGTGTGHGKQSPEERDIWLLANGGPFRGGAVLTQKCGHCVVPPTIFQHLGLAIDPAWGWEEKPLQAPVRHNPR